MYIKCTASLLENCKASLGFELYTVTVDCAVSNSVV